MTESYIRDLADEARPVLHSSLLQLSGAPTEATAGVEEIWGAISGSRKLELLSKMVELADDNPELDFDELFLRRLNDPAEDLRELAARGLWECEDRAALDPLAELLRRDPSAKVRRAAAASLGRFAAMAAEGKLIQRDAARVRRALTHAALDPDEDREVSWRSVEAAAPLAEPEISEVIREGYVSSDAHARKSAVHAMGRSADTQWLATLTAALDSDDSALRYEAALSCGMVGDISSVPHLISLLRDGDGEVEVAAVRALGAIGGDLAKRALTRCLNFGDPAVESAAESALNEIDALEDPTGFRY